MNISNLLHVNSASQYWSNFSRYLSTSLAPWSRLILATSVTSLVGLGVYRWSQVNQTAHPVVSDPAFDKVQSKIKTTYAYVFGGFALTAAAAAISHISGLSRKILTNNSYILPIGFTVLTCGSLIATLTIPKENSKAKHVAWGIFNASMGLMLSPLGFLNKTILAQAAFISLGFGGLLTLAAFKATDRRFLEWQGPLMAALTTLSVASAVAIFFPGSSYAYGVDRVSLYGGLALYSGLLMSSTQRLMQEAETQSDQSFDPISSSMSIYLHSMSIFIRIVRILAENDKKDD
jgi:FtsH-binding integral membrane protein